MLKSHQQENCGELYPIATDIFEHFLSESGFTCTNITNGFDIHKKGELYIKIPQKKNLTKNQVKNLLTKAGLQIEDFNLYIGAEDHGFQRCTFLHDFQNRLAVLSDRRTDRNGTAGILMETVCDGQKSLG